MPIRHSELFSREKVRESWLPGLALLAAVVVAFAPALRAGFIWDDDAYITDNPLLTAPDGLRRIWFSLDAPSQYFPLTYTTFYFERMFWGLNPAGYHLVNIMLHAANAILVWQILRRLSVPGAWLAGALFALHPVQVESVAWATERKNVLMGFFFLLTIWEWLSFLDEKNAAPARSYCLALVFYALSLSAKTTACTLPAALLLILWLMQMPIGWKRLGQVTPFLGMGIAMGLVTMWWERFHQGTQGTLFAMGPVERVLLANRALWFYLGKLAWPANLSFSYPLWTISRADPVAYFWVGLTVAASGLILWTRRRAGRGPETAALFYGTTLAPMLGFIMLYTFVYSFVADHYQYLACIGAFALAAAGLAQVPLPTVLRPFLYTILLAGLAVLTWRQCLAYADPETLWAATLERNPHSWLAHNRIGLICTEEGDFDEAIAHYRKMLALPEYQNIPATQPHFAEGHCSIGAALLQKGADDQAVAEFQKALEIDPTLAQAHHNLGVIYARRGQIDKAVVEYRKALEKEANRPKALVYLGTALMQQGNLDEAIARLQEALALQPSVVGAHNNLGIAYARQKKLAQAIAEFQKALELIPTDEEARANLQRAMATQSKSKP